MRQTQEELHETDVVPVGQFACLHLSFHSAFNVDIQFSVHVAKTITNPLSSLRNFCFVLIGSDEPRLTRVECTGTAEHANSHKNMIEPRITNCLSVRVMQTKALFI